MLKILDAVISANINMNENKKVQSRFDSYIVYDLNGNHIKNIVVQDFEVEKAIKMEFGDDAKLSRLDNMTMHNYFISTKYNDYAMMFKKTEFSIVNKNRSFF